MVDNGDH
jgi:hypothetical protein